MSQSPTLAGRFFTTSATWEATTPVKLAQPYCKPFYIHFKKNYYYYYFLKFLTTPWGLWDLSSPTRNQGPWQWKHRVLTTGPPANYLCVYFKYIICLMLFNPILIMKSLRFWEVKQLSQGRAASKLWSLNSYVASELGSSSLVSPAKGR